MQLQLKIAGYHHDLLIKHLLPEDGHEAVAVALCGRHEASDTQTLLVHEIIMIPHEECYVREYDVLHWPTRLIERYFERIGRSNLALMKIHSHPGGYRQFSETDDQSDLEFFDSAFGWASSDAPHCSAIMLPGGEIFGRFFFSDLSSRPITRIVVAGDVIRLYLANNTKHIDDFALRTIQAFGSETYSMLKHLTIGVVGCSGTGSPIIEQLTRLGVGKIILVDPDTIEFKNLNRIINSTYTDAEFRRYKVEVIADAIRKIGLGTLVNFYSSNLYDDLSALNALATCDILFGCLDSVDGRYLLNQLSSFYLLPYFDIGVKLEANGIGGIRQICGSVHYLQPGKSSLITRGVYTMEDLRAASQFRKNPIEYENLKKNSYIKNVNVDNPAVISVNMQIASMAINEFLNRIHPYKVESPACYAASTIDITEGYVVNSHEDSYEPDLYLQKKAGRGNTTPFIEIAELSR